MTCPYMESGGCREDCDTCTPERIQRLEEDAIENATLRCEEELFKPHQCIGCGETKTGCEEHKDVVGGDDWNWWCKDCLKKFLPPK